MTYEQIRELLLSQKALSSNEAMHVLIDWMDNDEMYRRFLEEGNAVALQAYAGYSEEEGKHLFVPAEVYVLSPRYAQLFFSVKDDMVNTLFATIVNAIAFGMDEIWDIYAWPYLTMACVQNLQADFLLKVIDDMRFVFDFSADENTSVFNCLYQKIEAENPYNYNLLAINSFNVNKAWILTKNGCRVETFLQNFFMANHSFGKGLPDAIIRKLFIQYFRQSRDETEEEMLRYMKQNN